jgi:hypothetical protein
VTRPPNGVTARSKWGREARVSLRMKVLSLVGGAGAAIVLACGVHEEVVPAIAVQPGAAARAMALLGHGGPNDPVPAVARPADAIAPGDDEDASADGYGYEYGYEGFNDGSGGQ